MLAIETNGHPAEGEAWIAGGTTLVDLMKLRIYQPRRLVEVYAAHEFMSAIRETEHGLDLGALVSMAQAEKDAVVQTKFPALHLALFLAASPQIREMATLGGNLLQKTRCPYYRDRQSPCNKRNPGSGCAAISGDESHLAILGTSEHCIANYPGDMAVALVALDAEVTLLARDGSQRRLPVRDLYRLPETTPHLETTLTDGELITNIHVPFGQWTGQTYHKVRGRASYAFAIASAAVAVKIRDNMVADVRIALGGLAAKPWRCKAAEQALRGQALDVETALEIGQLCFAESNASAQQAYKVELGSCTVARALLSAVGKA
ncbi:MAG: FAD binding domain-containing protein [Cyanobacteria bacterium P01_H01_bin.58]